jgi:phage-related minor tail protein
MIACVLKHVFIVFFFLIARTFATANRAAAAGSSRMAMATAGAVTAGALSYAYLQSKKQKKSTFTRSNSYLFYYLDSQSPIQADAKPIAGVK